MQWSVVLLSKGLHMSYGIDSDIILRTNFLLELNIFLFGPKTYLIHVVVNIVN